MSDAQETQTTAPPVDQHQNRAGFMVPVAREAHLTWWYSQMPLMEVGVPDTETMYYYQQSCVKEAQTHVVPEGIRSNFSIQIIQKRLASLGMVATPWMVVFIASLCRSPADAVMWTFFLKGHSVAKKSNVLSMQDIGELFPKGLPTRAGMGWMWDLQKLGPTTGPDNLLDYVRARASEA